MNSVHNRKNTRPCPLPINAVAPEFLQQFVNPSRNLYLRHEGIARKAKATSSRRRLFQPKLVNLVFLRQSLVLEIAALQHIAAAGHCRLGAVGCHELLIDVIVDSIAHDARVSIGEHRIDASQMPSGWASRLRR